MFSSDLHQVPVAERLFINTQHMAAQFAVTLGKPSVVAGHQASPEGSRDAAEKVPREGNILAI